MQSWRVDRYPDVYIARRRARSKAWVLGISFAAIPVAGLVVAAFFLDNPPLNHMAVGVALPVWLFFFFGVVWSLFRPERPFLRPFFSKKVTPASGRKNFAGGQALALNYKRLETVYGGVNIEDSVYLFSDEAAIQRSREGSKRLFAFMEAIKDNLSTIQHDPAVMMPDQLVSEITALSDWMREAEAIQADAVLIVGTYAEAAGASRERLGNGFWP